MSKGTRHTKDQEDDDTEFRGLSWGININDIGKKKDEDTEKGSKGTEKKSEDTEKKSKKMDEDTEEKKREDTGKKRSSEKTEGNRKKSKRSKGSSKDKKDETRHSLKRPKKIPVEVESVASYSKQGGSGRLLITFVVIGVAVLIVGLALKFYVVPGMKVAPEDLSTAVEYEGTVELLDMATLTSQEFDVNVRATYNAEEVDGNELDIYTKSMITESETGVRLTFLEAEGSTFTIDRTTFEYVDDIHSGQWLFPIGVEKKDYTFWNEDLGRTSVCEYIGTSDHEEMKTYEYRIEEEDIELSLADALGDEETAAQLEAIGAVMTCNVDITFWVDPVTGIIIDLEKQQERYLTFPDDTELQLVNQELQFTPEQVTTSRELARDTQDQLKFMGFYMPLIFTIEGAILTVLGIAIVRYRMYPARKDDEATFKEKKEITSAQPQKA